MLIVMKGKEGVSGSKLRYVPILLIFSALAISCGQKSANLQEDAVAPDKTLYENGMKYLEKNQYIKSRLALQTLINTYPDSDYTPGAYLSIADSYYREGGTEGLLQAESQYKDFIIYFPTHEMADDAQLRVAAVNFKLMNSPDRDPTHTRKASVELTKFLEQYSDSELAPTAKDALKEVNENAALGIQGKANFYFKRRSWRAAENRYKEVLEDHPDFSGLDTTLYRLGETLLQMGRTEEASVYFSQLAAEFPFSSFFNDSREKLSLLEKPVPEVDEARAEIRRSNLPPKDSGSFMNPMNLLKGIFSGREDLYEVARKRAEERALRQGNGLNESKSKQGSNNR